VYRTEHTRAQLARQYGFTEAALWTAPEISEKGEPTMTSGKTDELKGRVKEAAGALTDDKKLKREGQVDQAAGKIKQNVEKMVDKVKGAIR
jgi:uncharacterized protein YjbJ (UPF0337 family)